MITTKTFKDRTFSDKKELFKELVANKDSLIALKKSTIKETDSIVAFNKEYVSKSIQQGKELEIGDTIKMVINTTGYLDSHEDVHIKGNWNKTASEQTGKTYHIINHDLAIGSIIGYPRDVQVVVEQKSWRDLGYNSDGITDALVFKTKTTDKTNIDAFKAFRDNEPVQGSIRMSYGKIVLCINDPEFKEEYSNYLKYSQEVVNKEKLDELGFFWAVIEAKIEKEGSTLLFGSNDITPYMGIETTPSEPPFGTHKEPIEVFDVSVAIKKVNFFN